MGTVTPRMVFVNLAVRDLDKAKQFFAALGFTFNPQFTDDNAACMVLSEMGYVMLLREPFFSGFMKKAICDTRTHQEALVALSCTSRAEVDALLAKALAAGGSDTGFTQDYGFMYGRGFHDLDGHHWEIMWMDPSHVQ